MSARASVSGFPLSRTSSWANVSAFAARRSAIVWRSACLSAGWRRVGPPLLVGVPRGVDCPIDVLRSPSLTDTSASPVVGFIDANVSSIAPLPRSPPTKCFERAVRQQIVGEVAVSTFDNFESCL